MLNTLKILLITAAVYFSPATTGHAQMISDPTAWTYDVKHLGGDLYEVAFHLTLKEGWHIWSVNPGGDGLQIPPSFTFDENKSIHLDGRVLEIGKKITDRMEGIDGEVYYYSNKVNYTQVVAVTDNTKLTGKHEYQVCNDRLCLPPKTLKFSVSIKK
jgi:DsbC/DsbD-like thiol-disulfide interchange protein